MKSNQAIWKVSALNFEIKTLLEQGIGSIWIEGEVSNFAQPASGHWYFSLKDERAQVRAAMFKNRNARVAFTPENGQQILVRAQVTLYEARGDFQLIVEHMEEAGLGRLMREYEALKNKLASEGLFAEQHKKTIPSQAHRIGIITSASGAAIRDALSVIERRSPASEVTVYPTPVQGEAAGPQIVQAIEQANRHAASDVLLLIRGGGSLEDLWCFNEETVARAIFDSAIPIVSGVGHEIDFTIADLVADLRAPTPSVAAESVTMDQFEIMSRLDQISTRLNGLMQQSLATQHDALQHLQGRLLAFHPQRQMDALSQRLQHAQTRLSLQMHKYIESLNSELLVLKSRLHNERPSNRIQQQQFQINALGNRLINAMQQRVQTEQHRLGLQANSLDKLSPLKTLARGFATVSRDDKLINSVKQLKSEDEIEIQFQDGKTAARVL